MRELGDSENEDEIEEQLDEADPCLFAFASGAQQRVLRPFHASKQKWTLVNSRG